MTTTPTTDGLILRCERRRRHHFQKALLCYLLRRRGVAPQPPILSLDLVMPNDMPPRRISRSSSKERESPFLPPKEGQMRFWARHGGTGRYGKGRDGRDRAKRERRPMTIPFSNIFARSRSGGGVHHEQVQIPACSCTYLPILVVRLTHCEQKRGPRSSHPTLLFRGLVISEGRDRNTL